MKNKSFITIVAAVLLFASCNRPYDTVYSTYKDGSPKLVFTVIDGKGGEVTRLGEKMYYENGKLMYDKHFDGNKPCGIWKFYYENGQLHAEGSFDKNDSIGSDWKLFKDNGEDFYTEQYDSMVVLAVTADHRPLSVSYFKDNTEMRFQFNENYTINTRGLVKNGLKEGRWEFFYANGQKMLEANYSKGIENGAYNSYRDNGIPYFRGFYINGQRANIWEFYDEAGNLAGRQDFDTH
ncbi:MAG: hypothetical protein J6031_05195 [Bacteroidales bacterium]|nr:hypothetical protein [Bacteroidales bacterium]